MSNRSINCLERLKRIEYDRTITHHNIIYGTLPIEQEYQQAYRRSLGKLAPSLDLIEGIGIHIIVNKRQLDFNAFGSHLLAYEFNCWNPLDSHATVFSLCPVPPYRSDYMDLGEVDQSQFEIAKGMYLRQVEAHLSPLVKAHFYDVIVLGEPQTYGTKKIAVVKDEKGFPVIRDDFEAWEAEQKKAQEAKGLAHAEKSEKEAVEAKPASEQSQYWKEVLDVDIAEVVYDALIAIDISGQGAKEARLEMANQVRAENKAAAESRKYFQRTPEYDSRRNSHESKQAHRKKGAITAGKKRKKGK